MFRLAPSPPPPPPCARSPRAHAENKQLRRIYGRDLFSAQVCSAGSRLLIQETVYEKFIAKVCTAARTVRVKWNG